MQNDAAEQQTPTVMRRLHVALKWQGHSAFAVAGQQTLTEHSRESPDQAAAAEVAARSTGSIKAAAFSSLRSSSSSSSSNIVEQRSGVELSTARIADHSHRAAAAVASNSAAAGAAALAQQ